MLPCDCSRTAKNTLIKLPCCIKWAFQIITPTIFTTLLQPNHQFSLRSFTNSTQYNFSVPSVSQAPKTIVSPLQLYNVSQQFQTRAKSPLKFLYNKQTKKLLPSVTQIFKFTATPTCYVAKQPHLSPIKITFIYKNLPGGTDVRTAQTII